MTASTTDTSPAESQTAQLADKPRLLLWLVRFILPVFIIGTILDPNGLQLIDRAALAVCPLTWLMFERAVRGQTMTRKDAAPQD